ncbi:hypothetical protein RND71_004530 [Anisodus tanguticus]|uniref:Carboxypeptidase A inhibitor-like domain-containing protein n=1 Tax=Anisodus tanguticus TaxID=243964 RepID=A0AAE1VKQ0_9SOLA|nr:hypothetical protein RND71_004530 [Anisodus tanguticus]
MAKKCLSHKLSFFFCVLLVILAVDSFWSTNTQVMALRDIQLVEVQAIVLQDLTNSKGCGKLCSSDADCNNKGSRCRQCRTAHNHYDITMRCYPRI